MLWKMTKRAINKGLARILMSMAEKDRRARIASRNTNITDTRNAAKLKKIIKEYGWPGNSLVGERAAEMAWLIVQHSDHDLKFQKACLILLKKAVSENEAKKENLAYLTDRVLVRTGNKQLYGTQFLMDKKTKTLHSRPIKNLENLEILRRSMGLEPFKKYARQMQRFYGVKVSLK